MSDASTQAQRDYEESLAEPFVMVAGPNVTDTRVRLEPLRVEAEHDPVNAPAHYRAGQIECIAAIRAALTPAEFRGYCKGNALKYLWRERGKGGDQDLQKANWYLVEAQQ